MFGDTTYSMHILRLMILQYRGGLILEWSDKGGVTRRETHVYC